MGESLLLSWLRHVKKCQTVQTNWKPSTASWEIYNEKSIEKIMVSTSNFFKEKHDFNIFKNNKSYSQLLQQGEIDVLGLEIRNGSVENLYGIDVAFHEAGLNYGSGIETIERVIKKMVRAAMIIYAYYNVIRGQIIFASPKINKAIHEPLVTCVNDLKVVFKDLGFEYEFILYANESFKEKVFEPVLELSRFVADTSELFKRSVQMYNMFAEVAVTLPINDENVLDLVKKANKLCSQEDSNVNRTEMKIGAFVQSSMKRLVYTKELSKEMVAFLIDAKYCKNTFDINYPFLKKVEKDRPLSEQRKINGYYRYWADEVIIYGEKYIMCNDWYDRNRTSFIKWLEKNQYD